MSGRSAISTELLEPRLPALGHIKIGGRKPSTVKSSQGNEFQPPVKYDHFRVTTRTRGPDGNFVVDEAIHREIGEKPTELLVRLPFDTRAQNFYAQMVHYRGKTRERECDGETQLRPSTQVSGVCSRKQGQECPCKPYGRLSVILEAAPTFGGLYVFRTTSWESVNSIQTALRMFEEQFGSLRGLPLVMKLYPAEVRYQDGGKEKTATAYKVAIVLRANFEEARQVMLDFHRQNQLARREVLELAGHAAEDLHQLDLEDAEHIGGEFFPPTDRKRIGSGSASSPLAEINRAIAGEPVEDEPEEHEEPEQNGGEPTVDDMIQDLEGLMEKAREAGLQLTDSQRDRLKQAIQERDEARIRTGCDWLRDEIERKEAS